MANSLSDSFILRITLLIEISWQFHLSFLRPPSMADCASRSLCCPQYGGNWSNFTLDPTIDFTVFHKVVESTLHIRLHARTTGWLGFGFGEPTSGHMKGADMMTAYCVGPIVYLQDRYADFAATDDSGYGYQGLTAKEDRNNDWSLVSGYEDDGVTHIYATRPLVTGDGQDRAVGAGPTRVLWAWCVWPSPMRSPLWTSQLHPPARSTGVYPT